MLREQTIIKTGVVITLNDLYWGIQYEDGQSTCYDWGPIENAEISDPKYLKKPEDATYKNSHYMKELRKGTIVSLKRQTTYSMNTLRKFKDSK